MELLILILSMLCGYLFWKNGKLNENVKEKIKSNFDLSSTISSLQHDLDNEKNNNSTILSQKKSSETRLGQITEHIVPFLSQCPYNAADMHFLGQPLDYIIFDLDQGEVVFLEVKTGNSQPSKKQKLIKNIIKSGNVHYREMRISDKGVTFKK